jgi:hypothetical protein
MVAYTDVPAANALYEEQERVNQALTLLDSGGSVSAFTVIPPPPAPPDPLNPPTTMTMMLPVMLQTVQPTPEMIAVIRDAIVARSAAITTQLLALGVTDPPPDPPPPEGRRAL